ncbi:hypothetical protein PIB30_078529 [Stylosanthes scabra]|uniref:Uncharacterized protein n=1 Tax=Stylosanthes scabra TaxID=79078 RepID=A0ABU6XPG3_9FABA|nr:hypothetical protein [Stylosanthes scabra]
MALSKMDQEEGVDITANSLHPGAIVTHILEADLVATIPNVTSHLSVFLFLTETDDALLSGGLIILTVFKRNGKYRRKYLREEIIISQLSSRCELDDSEILSENFESFLATLVSIASRPVVISVKWFFINIKLVPSLFLLAEFITILLIFILLIFSEGTKSRESCPTEASRVLIAIVHSLAISK